MKKQEVGKTGEQAACNALQKKGYRILERNYRCRQGEIDIVARHKGCLVFIEVRSKTGSAFGTPGESITSQKKQKLVSSALEYMGSHRDLPEDWRIDFVAVELDPANGRPTRIEITENAVC